MVKNIKIANSDLEITSLGFGCARLDGGIGREHSNALLQSAYDNGIKHFDTAPMYQTEEILGKFFRGVSDVTFCSKVGIDPVENSQEKSPLKFLYKRSFKHVLSRFPGIKKKLLSATGAYKPYIVQQELKHAKIMTKDYILRRLESTLRNLMRDSLDIYLVHEPDLFLLGPDTQEIFEELKASGYIRSYGLGYSRPMASREVGFGSVLQCGWDHNAVNSDGLYTNIYHGVLRAGNINNILHLVKSEMQVATIFSASTVRQIDQLMNTIRRA